MDYRERWELKDYLIGRTLTRRIVLFQIALSALTLGFLLGFWYLQGVKGDEYARLAENNRLRRIAMPPMRGVILDRRDEVIAATRPSLSLVLVRERAQDPRPQLERLAPILGVPVEELLERLRRMRSRPLYEPLVLKEDVGLEHLARIESRRELFPSVEVQQKARRSYPHGDHFAHALGYVGEVNDAELAQAEAVQLQLGDIVGKSGIERSYDDPLRGERGWRVVSVNNLGRRMGDPRIDREPRHGETLRLTLDHEMQAALREGLGQEAGAGVFLDPHTGDVLALVSTPTFDANMFADGISRSDWRTITEDPRRPLHDRAIASFYAPGSTFKVLMAIAGLETGTVTPQDTVHCSGSARVYGHTRLCWKKGGHGTVDLRRALAQSCNVYFYLLGQRMGIDPITDWGSRFGLGAPTGLDVPGEARGILPSRDWKQQQYGEPWFPGDTISVAIGQGLLAVTPMQMAVMVSGVAADGKVPVPRLVRGDEPPAGRDTGVRAATLRIVRAALRDAVAAGTGRRGDIEGIGVAGKTGTAQVFKHSAGIDADELPKAERDHAWFMGFAPADEPRVAFAVVVEHGGHGGSTAAPIARRVLEVFFSDPPRPDAQQADDELQRAEIAPDEERRGRTAEG